MSFVFDLFEFSSSCKFPFVDPFVCFTNVCFLVEHVYFDVCDCGALVKCFCVFLWCEVNLFEFVSP